MTLEASAQACWRIEFRRRLFTHVRALQTGDRYLESYNHRRPHSGYRTHGRPPAQMFWGMAWRGEDEQRAHP